MLTFLPTVSALGFRTEIDTTGELNLVQVSSPSNSVDFANICLCDVTVNSCDAYCCCDDDCAQSVLDTWMADYD